MKFQCKSTKKTATDQSPSSKKTQKGFGGLRPDPSLLLFETVARSRSLEEGPLPKSFFVQHSLVATRNQQIFNAVSKVLSSSYLGDR